MSDFFTTDALSFGTLATKTTRSNRVDPKAQFIKMAGIEIERIDAGETSATWYRSQPDGTVIVTLRNGIRLLNKDRPMFVCKDMDSAKGYLNAAMAACQAGKFDAIFELQVKRL